MVKLNSDGSFPMWMDAEGRPQPTSETNAVLTATGGDGGPHTHPESEVTNLTADLAGKAPTHSHPYAATAHGHAQSDVTNLTSALSGKSDTSHTHAYEAAGSVAAHAAAGDPHPTYLTTAEGNAAYAATNHSHGGQSGEAYAVGDLYITTRDGDPATLLGYGTWSRFGVGRFLLLTDTTAGVTGGSATHSHTFQQPTAGNESAHSHTYSQVVNHVHPQMRFPTATGGSTGFTVDTSMSGTQTTANDTGNPTGGVAQGTTAAGSAHTHSMSGGAVADGSTNPLSITAFAWVRTA